MKDFDRDHLIGWLLDLKNRIKANAIPASPVNDPLIVPQTNELIRDINNIDTLIELLSTFKTVTTVVKIPLRPNNDIFINNAPRKISDSITDFIIDNNLIKCSSESISNGYLVKEYRVTLGIMEGFGNGRK